MAARRRAADGASTSDAGAREARALPARHPRLLAWLLVVFLLGMWGNWAGPRWNPEPMRSVVVPETSDTAVVGKAPSPPVGTYQIEKRQVQIRLRDGTSIPAQLTTPVGVRGLVPGIVFVHGTGTKATNDFDESTDLISSAGIATLVPMKRTANYSTTHRDYLALADDYEDAFSHLLGVPGVDPKRSGLYTVSEGCFIGPIIAARNASVSFVVLVSAPVLPIRVQGALAADAYLRRLGAPSQMREVVSKLVGQQFGEDFRYIDFDVSQYQRKMTMPVLMVYGTDDMSMPTVQGPVIMRSDLEKAGNNSLTIRYYKGGHGLKVDGVAQAAPMRDVSDWVNGLPSTASAEPRIAGEKPLQAYKGKTMAAAPKFASGKQLMLTLGVGALALIVSSLLLAVGRMRAHGRRLIDTRGMGPCVVASSAGIIVAWCVLVLYLVALAYYAVSYQRNLIVVQGGWIACQGAALLSAWLFVRVPFCWHEKKPKMRAGATAVVGAALGGQTVLLLMLAYWGPFPSLR